MSKQNAPFVVRWRNGVMDDPNPILTWRALVAAMALTRYADVKTGHNCFPGAKKCADVMRVSERTIRTGWEELVKAGWLEIAPLPANRRREQGALKVLRWARKAEPNHLHDVHQVGATTCTSGDQPMHVVPSTIPGNQESLRASGEAPQTGKDEQPCAGCGGPLGYKLDGDGPTDGALCLACFNRR